MTVQYTQAHLDALLAAVASGEKMVSYDGKSVTYRSVDEINQVIAQITAKLAVDDGTPPTRQYYASSTKGT